MSSPKKGSSAFLYSTVGLAAVAAILILVNYIASTFPGGIDLTEEKIHTLSKGTRAIIDKIPGDESDEVVDPVTLDYFVTRDTEILPTELQTIAERIGSFLEQYAQIGGKKIQLKRHNPEPDTDDEDAARLAGMQAQRGQRGEYYFGLKVSYLEKNLVIPFLPAVPQETLEYEVSRAISQVVSIDKPVAAVVSSYEISGSFGNPMMGGGGQTPPWFFYEELERDYEVRTLADDLERIPDDVDVLILLHTGIFTPTALFAIDQYVLAGGKLMVCVDPLSISAQMSMQQSQRNPAQPPLGGPPESSNLETMFSAWGYTFSDEEIVTDLNLRTPIRGGQENPALLSLTRDFINQDDPATSRLSTMLFLFAGEFKGEPKEGINEEVLIHTSEASSFTDKTLAQQSPQEVMRKFEKSGEEKKLALRLSGTFPTAFPDGEPENPDAPADAEGGEDAAENSKPAVLTEGNGEGIVIVIGDSDFINDQFAVQIMDFFGQRVAQMRNQNLPFFQNATEILAGDSNLVSIRSRASAVRPFTRIKELEEEANDQIREQLVALDDKRKEAEDRLNVLQAQKDDTQATIMTPEQQKEIEKFQEAQTEAMKEQRKLQKDARKQLNSMIAWIKAGNVAFTPLLVAIVGIFVSVMRKKKTSAR